MMRERQVDDRGGPIFEDEEPLPQVPTDDPGMPPPPPPPLPGPTAPPHPSAPQPPPRSRQPGAGTREPEDERPDRSTGLANTPLAIAGSFATPGTQSIRPFRTAEFTRNRFIGGAPRDLRFGAGSAIAGMKTDPLMGGNELMNGEDDYDDEEIARAVAGRLGRGPLT